jgi:hypothetical protein
MKSGMEMMLESLGIQTEAVKQLLDPKNIKQLLDKIETLCNSVEEIKISVMRIEIKLGTLPEPVAIALLEDGQSQAFKDAVEFVRTYNGNNGDSNDGNINGDNTGSNNGATSDSGRGI